MCELEEKYQELLEAVRSLLSGRVRTQSDSQNYLHCKWTYTIEGSKGDPMQRLSDAARAFAPSKPAEE